MSLYRYSARRLSGELVTGEGAAASVAELTARLSGEGLVLVDAAPVGGRFRLGAIGGRKVRLPALLTFIREFRALAGAGMPVARALAQLENRRDDPALAGALVSVRSRVEEGAALDAAMAEHPRVFDGLMQATVRAGLATGRLEDALDRLLAYLTLRHQLQRKIRRAMAYPVFLLILLAVVLAVLMLFVLPRFSELYAEFDADLPWMTQVLMASVRAAPVAVPALVLGGIAMVLLFRLWLSLPAARLAFDRLRLRLPVFGPIVRNIGLVQISFMMSLLLGSGMPLRDALRFASGGVTNADQAARLARVGAAVSSGRSVGAALEEEGVYPDLSQALIAAGEAAGELDRMFGEVSKLHEEMLEDRLGRVIALIEPAMMLIVGIVLGVVIVAVYLPIFGISSVVE